jgi:hypothetical protein
MKTSRLARVAVAIAAAGALSAGALVGSTADAAAPDGTSYYKVVPTCATASAGHAQCLTLQRVRVSKEAKGAQAVTPSVPDAGPAGGFTPGNLASAYSIDPNTPTPGQVVGIVDAHDNPDAVADLNAFDAQYGLPAESATSLVKVGQNGGAPPANTVPPTDEEIGWAGEIALDLEAVRGICHTCKILLVEANTSEFTDLAAGVNTAVQLGATVVSNSFGGAEDLTVLPGDEHDPTIQAAFNHPGVVITASTADDGYYDYDAYFDGDDSSNAPSSPASFPSVVAAAGTTLQLNDDGTRAAEVIWNTNGQAGLPARFYGGSLFASGGGCSTEFNAPAWQLATQGWAQTACGAQRLTADVAALGDPLTGYDVYDTYSATNPAQPWGTFGGTSLSSPLIAGMFAMAGGANGTASPALTLYGHQKSDPGSLYDVTSGGIGICDGLTAQNCAAFFPAPPNTLGSGILDCQWVGETATRAAGSRACNAATGYDGASGVGTPNGLTPFKPLPPKAVIAHKKIRLGHRVTFTGTGSSDPYPGGTITSYSWKVGKGKHTKTGTGSTLDLKTKKPGKYTVTLTITDNYGFTGTTSIKVKVKASKHHRHHH